MIFPFETNKMIEFKENQRSIYLGKNKIAKSNHHGWLDFYLVWQESLNSGYSGKSVRVLTFQNKYSIDFLKTISSENFEELSEFKYFENGGYSFDKKLF